MPIPFRRLGDEFEKAKREGSWRRLGAILDRNFSEVTAQLDQMDPAGRIEEYAGSTAPSGWLMCDGAEVSRTTYARLFNAIGETYGAGDGSTTFNVPNRVNRLSIGAGTTALGATTSPTPAVTVVDATFNTGDDSPDHDHGNTGGASARHLHDYQDYSGDTAAVAGVYDVRTTDVDVPDHTHGTGGASARHVHSANHGHTGSATAPFTALAMNFIIRT